MANGLRKLIRNANRFSKSALLANRIKQYEQRLKVEELEERVAPAALAVNEYFTYDIAGGTNGAFDATDGLVLLGSNTTAGVTATFTATDDTSPTLTFTGPATGTVEIDLATNLSFSNLDFSGINAATTSLTLNIQAGADIGAANGTLDFAGVNIDGIATGTANTQAAGSSGATIANTNDPAVAGTAQGIGAITLPASSALTVQAHIIAGGTGTITSITSTDVDVDLIGDATNTQDSLIDAGAITTFNWAGEVKPNAEGVTLTVDNNAGAGLGALTIGTVNSTGAGHLVINAEGIGATTITSGVTIASTGNVTIDSDTAGGNDDGVTGAVSLGGLTLSNAGDFTFDGGGSGFTSTIGTGNIAVSGTGNNVVSITTSNNAAMTGLVTAGTITHSSTGTSSITIAPNGSGNMAGGFTSGLISNTAVSVAGAIVIGSATGTMGPVTVGGITIASTNAGGDVTIQGTTMGTTSLGAVTNSSTATADLLVTGTTSIGAFSATSITLSGAGDVTINGGTTGFASTVGTGNIAVSGSTGGDLLINTTTNGPISGLVTTGTISNTGTGTSNITIQSVGSGLMTGFTSGLISNSATGVNGAIVIGNAGGVLGAVTVGGITIASTNATGDVTIQGTTMAATSLGAITNSATAAADLSVTATTSIGAFTASSMTLSGTGDVSINAGTTGFTSTVGTGNIAVSGTTGGDLLINTTTNGAISGLVTTGTISNTATGTSNITIQSVGTGVMTGFTSGLISNSATAVLGAIVIGNSGAALGTVTLGGATIASTNNTGDLTIQGSSIGTVTSSAAIQTGATGAGDIIINAATTSMGDITVATGGIAPLNAGANVTITATTTMGNIDINGTGNLGGAGTTLITAGDGIGTIDVANGNIGGAGAVTITADTAGTADTGDIGTITVAGVGAGVIGSSGASAVAIQAVNIGNITANTIGVAAGGAVSFTATSGNTALTTNGTIGNILIANDIIGGGNGGANVGKTTFTADNAIGNITVTSGDVGGAGDVEIIADSAGVADTGDVGTVSVSGSGKGKLGSGVGEIIVQGVNVGNVSVNSVGVGSGNVRIEGLTAADTTLTTKGTLGDITVSNGNILADAGNAVIFRADNAIGNINVVKGNAGGAGTLTIKADNAGVADTGNIGTLTVAGTGAGMLGNAAGTVNIAGVSIGDITTNGIGSTGGTLTIDALSGADTATTTKGTIGNIVSNGTIGDGAVSIDADNGIGNVTVTGGNLGGAGAVNITADNAGVANTGNVGNIAVSGTGAGLIGNGVGGTTVQGVNIGTITSNAVGTGAGAVTFTATSTSTTDATMGTIGNVSVTGNMDAAGGVTYNADNAMGNVAVTGNMIGAGTITIKGDKAGVADTGAVGTVTVDGTIGVTGVATAVTLSGASIGNITAGAITPTGATGVFTATARGTIGTITSSGDIGQVGTEAVITADDNISGTGDVGNVTADGLIAMTGNAVNFGDVISGGDTTDNISGTITATADIDFVNAGQGQLLAAVNAQVATVGSPLATFISQGISYGVWVFQAGTTTDVAAATANVTFEDTGAPSLNVASLNIAGATAPDVYVTTRVATNAEQVFSDTDIAYDDIAAGNNLLVTISATGTTVLGVLNVEGDYDLSGDADIQPTTTAVEGGVKGTTTVTAGQSLNYGSVFGNFNLTIGNGTTDSTPELFIRNGITAGNVTITGNVTELRIGDASDGRTGNVADGSIVNLGSGTLGDVEINGSMNGSLLAASIGNVNINGNVANAITTAEKIQATTGNIGDVNVDGSIGSDVSGFTIESVTGSIGNVLADGSIGAGGVSILANTNIGNIESTGTIGDNGTLAVITATNGTVGTVTASGNDTGAGGKSIDVTLTAGGNIAGVTSTHQTGGQGEIAGTITSNTGNVGTVSTIEGDIEANITAPNGDILNVLVLNENGDIDTSVSAGDISGTISAGGNINQVLGFALSGTVTADAATAASPVTVFMAGGVVYTFEGTTSGPLYAYSFDGGTIDVTIDNWDNTGSAPFASNVDITLMTSDEFDGELNPTQFNLGSLNFDSDSTANGADNLGTLRVEGSTDLIEGGSLTELIVEGDAALPVSLSNSSVAPVNFISVGSAQGVDDPSATELAGLFSDPGGSAISFAAPADPSSWTVPASSNSNGDDVSVALGNATGFDTPMLLDAGSTGVADWTVSLSGGDVTVSGANTTAGTVTILGNLEEMIFAEDVAAFTVSNSILAGGGIEAFNIDSVTIGTPGDLTTGNMDGTIRVINPFDPNGNLPGDGSITGAVNILGDVGPTGMIDVDVNTGAITIGQEVSINNALQWNGDFAGTLQVDGNTGGITFLNDFTGVLAIGGNSGAIVSDFGDIGGSGLIAVGGGLTAVTANNGNISADLLIGGTAGGGDAVVLQAQSVSGDLSIGFVNGIDNLTVNLLEDTIDTGNPFSTVLANTNNAGMHVEIASGNITSTGTTIDQVTLIEDSTSLSALASDGRVDLTALYIVEDNSVVIDVSVPGTLGTVVAAEGATAVEASQAHQDGFIAAYNTAEGTSVSVDVVNAPTAYDAALDNNSNSNGIALTIDVFATSVTGGILSSGNLNVDYNDEVNNDSMGWLVSLDGTVTATVDVDGSIGDIVAESGISGTFVAGTTIAVSGTVASPVDTDLTGALTTSFGSAIGGGVPTWFTGGVLSETGNSSASFTAGGTQDLVTVNGTSFIASSGDAMGIVYAPMGNVTGSYFLKGNFGGFQVPMGTVSVSGYVDSNGFAPPQISQVIADTYTFTASGGVVPEPNLELVSDGFNAFFVTESQPFVQTFVDGGNNTSQTFVMNSITVTGSNTLVWVNNNADSQTSSEFEQIVVIGGLAADATVNVLGAGDELSVLGDWAGVITFSGNSLVGTQNSSVSSEDHVLGIIYDDVIVKGDIDVATARLNAFKFPAPVHDGGYLNNGVPVSDPMALNNSSMGDQFGRKLLNGKDRVLNWTNQNGKEQSLTLQGSKKITAEVDLFFGEVLTVDIQGRGNAGLVSAEGLSGSDSDIAKQAKGMSKAAGRMDDHPGFVTKRAVLGHGSIAFNSSEDVNAVDFTESRNVGSAHVLELRVGTGVGSVTNLNGLVINGDADQVNSLGKAKGVWISGHVGEFDVTQSVSKTTFLDQVSEFKTNQAKDIKFLDSVRTFTATTADKILIDGDGETASNDDVSIFSVIKANNVDVNVGINELHANRLNRFSVDDKVDNLIMYGGNKGSVMNSLFQDGVGSHNIDYQKFIETSTTASGGAGGTGGSGGGAGSTGGTGGAGGNGAVGPVLVNFNSSYNPIKVRNTSGLFGFAGNV